MGGVGSGNRGERFNTLYADDCDSIRIWTLQRHGLLVPGQHVTGALHLDCGRALTLDVDATELDRGALEVEGQRIRLFTTPGTLGGLRWWFRCPATGDRIAVLYRHPRMRDWCGRKDPNLRYRSSYLAAHDVSIRRAQKALRRLAGSNYAGPRTRDVSAIPRPPGRRWRTHRSYQRRALRALRQADEQLARELERLVGPTR